MRSPPVPEADPPNTRNTTPHQLVDRILEDIANPVGSGFYPGVQLVEAELQKKYATSRVTIRTVLALLEGMGLVTNIPYRGRFVRKFTDKQIRDMYLVRAVNESLAARLAAAVILPHQVMDLEAILRECEAAAHEGDTPKLERSDYEFHAFIQRICGNDMLGEVLGRSQLLFTLIRVVHRERRDDLLKQRTTHREIFDALKHRDPAKAEQAVWLHLEPSFT